MTRFEDFTDRELKAMCYCILCADFDSIGVLSGSYDLEMRTLFYELEEELKCRKERKNEQV